MTKKWLGLIVIILIFILINSLFYYVSFTPKKVEKVADFTLNDLEGNTFSLTDYRGKIVILDFMATWCGSCKIVEKNLHKINEEFGSDIVIISIDVDVTETEEEVLEYKKNQQINWTIAIDKQGEVKLKYDVTELAKVVIIDQDGYAIYEFVGANINNPDEQYQDMRETIKDALKGETDRITIQEVSMFVFAIGAGIATFFSPCSFPMLPGYIGLYLEKESKMFRTSERPYKRALLSGSISAFGIVLIFIIIGILVIYLGNLIRPHIPLLGPIVGIFLIIIGLLLLSNIQYHILVKPFQRIRQKLGFILNKNMKNRNKDQNEDYTKKKNHYSELFLYGIGYGSAAAGCTAPLFLYILLAGILIGDLFKGFVLLFLYIGTIALLMIIITIIITIFGVSAAQKLNKYTNLIKKISAVILIIVGIYLIYFYYLQIY
jgi:cytochrome c-type biogenesis protein